ncbi:MAG: histidine--tRNA ligase [Thermoplasmata archaeon]
MERLRGFRDIYPEEMINREKIFRTAEDMSLRFGYEKIDFPSLESMDLYRLKSGEELVGQTFSFRDRGGREVTLIPEATPSVVRMLTSRKEIPRPVRWFSFGKYWRYEEPQSGRLREFYQYNADLFGVDTPEADSEIIGLAASILDAYGFAGEYVIKINSRKIMNALISGIGAGDPLQVMNIIDRSSKAGSEVAVESMVEAGIGKNEARKIMDTVMNARSVDDITQISGNDQDTRAELDRIRKTMELVRSYTDAEIRFDLSVVRGLAYYTGIVFEAFDRRGELRAILGGGRYDSLAESLSGISIPAVGFGMGDVVVELLLKRTGKWEQKSQGISVFVCNPSGEFPAEASGIASRLRKIGTRVIMDVSGRSLSSQLKSADRMGAVFSIILGKKEMEESSLTVRNMKSGEQFSVSMNGIEKWFQDNSVPGLKA